MSSLDKPKMLSAADFLKVFTPPEIPAESDYDIASNWLMKHGHQEPSQRTRAAIKSLSKSNLLPTLLFHYQEMMQNDVTALDILGIAHLRKVKDYFMFPLDYLNLSEYDYIPFERCLNSLIRSKISSLAKLRNNDQQFLKSIGFEMDGIAALKYEDQLNFKVKSYSGVWDRSILNELGHNEVSNKKLAKLRISEIYDIISAYPKSIPALVDLKNSIDPSQRSLLISSFITASSQNLLHAGTNTNDIILFFISTIESFLIIDPRAVLLDNASRPIRKYLKERDDTIPNIVYGLLNYGDNSLKILSEKLAEPTSKTVNNLTLDWYPDPIDALPDFRKQDIIESLISIFDSKEIFITDLVKEFAKKLLSLSKTYDIDDIKLKLEQLKWKFEENDLNNLDIMVKDIVESEIIDYKIHSQNPQISNDLKFSMLSYLYWPDLKLIDFNVPSVIKEQIDLYFESYKNGQKGRKLSLIDSGVVSIDLEFSDRVLSLDVSPSQASVIYCFNDDVTSLTSDQISTVLNMSPDLLEESLSFWTHRGVLKEANGNYQVYDISGPNE